MDSHLHDCYCSDEMSPYMLICLNTWPQRVLLFRKFMIHLGDGKNKEITGDRPASLWISLSSSPKISDSQLLM